MGGRQSAAVQHDVYQRRGIRRLHHRVARQRREHPRVAMTVGAMAGGAVVDIHRRARPAVIAFPQRFGHLLIVLVRRVLRVHRRQALEVAGDRGQVVLGHVLHAVDDHIAHAAEHRAAITAAGLEELHQLLFAPTAEAVFVVATQAFRDPTFQRRTAGQKSAAVGRTQGFFLHSQRPRRMARATVAEALDQVSATADHRIGAHHFRGIRHGRGKHPAPRRQRPTHAQGPGNVTGPVFLGDRFHALHEVRIQRLHVAFTDAGVRRIGHRWVKRTAALGDAMAHGLVEVREAVGAQAGLVRGDVGGIDHADGGLHRQAAGERLAALGSVAGDAVAGAGQVFALLDQVGVGGAHRAVAEQRKGRREGGDNTCFHGHRSLCLNQWAGIFQVLLANRSRRPVGQRRHQAGRVVT